MQRWAGHPIWLRTAEASVERWTPPFCGIRTSVVGWLGIQSVCSSMPRQKKRAGVCVCVCVCVDCPLPRRSAWFLQCSVLPRGSPWWPMALHGSGFCLQVPLLLCTVRMRRRYYLAQMWQSPHIPWQGLTATMLLCGTISCTHKQAHQRVCPDTPEGYGAPGIQMNVPAIITLLYPQTSLPPLAQGP